MVSTTRVSVTGRIYDSGDGRWAVAAAIDKGVPAGMRYQFGGHTAEAPRPGLDSSGGCHG